MEAKAFWASRIFWLQVVVIALVVLQVVKTGLETGQVVVSAEQMEVLGSALATIVLRFRTDQGVR